MSELYFIEMATHSSILAWRIPWSEEPGGLQSTESQRIRHDWSDLVQSTAHYFTVYTEFWLWFKNVQERKEIKAIPCITDLILLRMELPFSDVE